MSRRLELDGRALRAAQRGLYWLGRAVPRWQYRLACTRTLRGTVRGHDLMVRWSKRMRHIPR